MIDMQNEEQIQKLIFALKANRFDAISVPNGESASRTVLEMVPIGATVGIGDSATLRQIGIIDKLEKRGTQVVNPFVKELTAHFDGYETFDGLLRKSLGCDVFLTGVNAITMDGKLFYVDGVGNRIAGIIFGPEKVILVAGRNKIVHDMEEAFRRMKNVIAPAHAKHKKKRVPCAMTGECADCNSKERICNITTIIEKKPHRTDITIILIDEDLGLGWDLSWTEERKKGIESQYGRVTWEFINPWHPK